MTETGNTPLCGDSLSPKGSDAEVAQRYPDGIQSFPKLIEGGYVYVDKTAYIKDVTRHGQYIFLSRPRRFGKSLFLSTLKAYFEGQRHLFRGLAIDRMDMDWTPCPVLYFDFNTGLYESEEGLVLRLDQSLGDYESLYGIEVADHSRNSIGLRFERLIKAVNERSGRKAVILVDEYDKPLLEAESGEIFEKHQSLLKSFYGNLKALDNDIEFAFITGVARFNKVSIFSDLNNLKDISLLNCYADICGWTEQELLDNFRPGIWNLAKVRDEDFESTMKALRSYYDGYLFAPEGSRLYNPYSILLAIGNEEIQSYWSSTGTPRFLARRIRRYGMAPYDISGQQCTREELEYVGLESGNPAGLMFQTGYLTIAGYEKADALYTLRFPNREVEIGFARYLLPLYAPENGTEGKAFSYSLFKSDLVKGQPESFMERLATLFKNLPGEDHNESVYRAIVYLLGLLAETSTIAEQHSYAGRSDLVIRTSRYIYIFEFKYNKSVAAAKRQIYEKDYAGMYGMDGRQIYLIAANFTETKHRRGLTYEIIPLSPKR